MMPGRLLDPMVKLPIFEKQPDGAGSSIPILARPRPGGKLNNHFRRPPFERENDFLEHRGVERRLHLAIPGVNMEQAGVGVRATVTSAAISSGDMGTWGFISLVGTFPGNAAVIISFFTCLSLNAEFGVLSFPHPSPFSLSI